MRHIAFAAAMTAFAAFAASNGTLADDQDQNLRSQNQSQSDAQNRERHDTQAIDDEDTEFRGMEHAALGVLLGERQGQGVRVRDVLPDGPAEQAGLRPGDRITKFDGKPTNSYYEVIRQVNRLQPGQKSTVTIQRNGEEKEIRVTTASRGHVYGHGQQFSAERGPYPNQYRGRNQDQNNYQNRYSNRDQQAQGDRNRNSSNDYWQNEQGENQTASRRQNRWSYRGRDSERGVLGIDLDHQRGAAVIREVRPGSPAQNAGLRRGDEIVSVDGQQVRDSDDVMNDLHGREAGERVTIVVYRNGQQRNVQARLISAQQLDQQENGDRHQNREGQESNWQDNDGNQNRNDRGNGDQQDDNQR